MTTITRLFKTQDMMLGTHADRTKFFDYFFRVYPINPDGSNLILRALQQCPRLAATSIKRLRGATRATKVRIIFVDVSQAQGNQT